MQGHLGSGRHAGSSGLTYQDSDGGKGENGRHSALAATGAQSGKLRAQHSPPTAALRL